MFEDPLPDDPVQCADCNGSKSNKAGGACETCAGRGSMPMREWVKIFIREADFEGDDLNTAGA